MFFLFAAVAAGVLIALAIGQVARWLHMFSNRNRSVTVSDEVHQFLNGNIAQVLNVFEARRKKMKRNSDMLDILIFVSFGAFTWYFFHYVDSAFHLFYTAFVLLLVAILLVKRTFFRMKQFTKEFKQEVMQLLVKELMPGLGYTYNGVVPQEMLAQSGMYFFKEFYDSDNVKEYEGEDLISGEYEGVKMWLSDVEARAGEGEQARLVFSGSFMVAEFPDAFQGETYIVPDFSSVTLFDEMVRHLSNKRSFPIQGEQLQFNDDAFERVYDVFGTNEESTRAIVSQSMRGILLSIDSKVHNEVQVAVSFIGNRMYAGMYMASLGFEPNLHVSILDARTYVGAYQVLDILKRVVESIRESKAALS